ncbi:protein-disulfide reductase DsbD family protein [Pedobacter gandavensis]|uniref:protein-disulfide reductase DsbD domain-containing protein n=1 Tax=Pedobacter TaxID=84567 RepID=UPI000705E45E|nr:MULTISPECIES: protein-disulfide reductase DsbD domain-containing protein [Pedobacter]ALL04066.1 sugar transporter [Pedobacter sp. PACM 27299]MBC8987091.1 sugar transporter [Pedobacter sp. N36a]WGQ07850.1 protein-disulfide reductase DsbD family protein [Pedobacter gandavensis]
MKKISLILSFVLFTVIGASAQIEKPVTWSYAAKKISKTEAVVYMKATMDEGWHIYSQTLKPGGPSPTIFSFPASKDYTLVGKTTEPKATTYFDENFKMNVSYFGKQVIFQQKVKLNKATATVKGKVEFMVCNDKQCLPPEEVSFSIPVK